jgi:hypothetical protein
LDNATTATTAPSGRISGNPFVESSISNRSVTTLRTGRFTVTVAAVVAVQIAQSVATAAANTTLAAGSYMIIRPV